VTEETQSAPQDVLLSSDKILSVDSPSSFSLGVLLSEVETLTSSIPSGVEASPSPAPVTEETQSSPQDVLLSSDKILSVDSLSSFSSGVLLSEVETQIPSTPSGAEVSPFSISVIEETQSASQAVLSPSGKISSLSSLEPESD
jgi:hypothetical protein